MLHNANANANIKTNINIYPSIRIHIYIYIYIHAHIDAHIYTQSYLLCLCGGIGTHIARLHLKLLYPQHYIPYGMYPPSSHERTPRAVPVPTLRISDGADVKKPCADWVVQMLSWHCSKCGRLSTFVPTEPMWILEASSSRLPAYLSGSFRKWGTLI